MENQLLGSCDWVNCDAHAVNRVDFAKRVFPWLDTRPGSEKHCNLCVFHACEIRRTHLEYYERPIIVGIVGNEWAASFDPAAV